MNDVDKEGVHKGLTELIACAETGAPEQATVEGLKGLLSKETSYPGTFSHWLTSQLFQFFYDTYGVVKITFLDKKGAHDASFRGQIDIFGRPIFLFEDGRNYSFDFSIFMDTAHSGYDIFKIQSWKSRDLQILVSKLSLTLAKYFPFKEAIKLGMEPSNLSEYTEPLSDIVDSLRQVGKLRVRQTIDVLRKQQNIVEEALPVCLKKIEEYLSQDEEPKDTEKIIAYLEAEGFFSEMDKPVELELKKIVRKRLSDFLRVQNRVRDYKKEYYERPWALISILFNIPEAETANRVEAYWTDYCVTLVVEDDIYDKVVPKATPDAPGGVAWAETSWKRVNIFKKSASLKLLPKIKKHEERHQRNSFLMLQMETPLGSAQDEIIAYLEDGHEFSDILDLLTDSSSDYNYYKKQLDTASDRQEFRKIEEQWFVHCHRVFKAIQATFHMEEKDLDQLAMIPMARWRKLVDKPYSGDFLIIPKNNNVQQTLIDDVTKVLCDAQNAPIVERAGLADIGELAHIVLQSAPTINHFSTRKCGAGRVVFSLGDAVDVIITPSLSAIHAYYRGEIFVRK